jgi:hypothetical protein
MKTVVTIFFIFACTFGYAQTKRIAHRSHSGARNEKCDAVDGSYGKVMPRKIKVHLESGRDTMVNPWDSLARPYYLDTLRQPSFQEFGQKPIETVKEIGHIAGRLVL